MLSTGFVTCTRELPRGAPRAWLPTPAHLGATPSLPPLLLGPRVASPTFRHPGGSARWVRDLVPPRPDCTHRGESVRREQTTVFC